LDCWETATFNTTTCLWDVSGTQPLAPTTTITQPTCATATGIITVIVQNAGETYSFDNGATFQIGNSKSGLAAGNYNVIIKSISGCNSATASTVINAIPNCTPLATNDTPSDVIEDSGLTTISVLGNDSFGDDGPNGGSIIVTPILASIGTAVLNNGGSPNDPIDDSIDFTPSLNYNGAVSISYTILDANGDTSTATVSFNVTAVNDAPIVDNDTNTTTEDNPTVGGDLTNAGDTDPDGTPLLVTTTPVSGPTNGTIVINADGTYVYTPNPNFNGTDVITIEVCDSGTPLPKKCVNQTLTITVNPVNNPIIAKPDNAGPIVGVDQITLNVVNVLANDTFNGQAVSSSNIILTTIFANPYLQLNADGSVDVLPNAPEGSHTLTYQICEKLSTSNCSSSTVTIVVEKPIMNITVAATCINDVPYITYTATPVNFTPVNGLTITWSDSNNNVISNMTNLPLSGNVLWPGATIDQNGNGTDWPGWLFTNNQWIEGNDGFQGLRPSATLAFTLNPTETIVVNYPPSDPNCTSKPTFNIDAIDDNAGLVNGLTGAIDVINVFTDDTLNALKLITSDVTLTQVTPDPKGALILNPDGSVDVKAGTQAGTYQLTYQICENADNGNCDSATVTITVNAAVIISQDDTIAGGNGTIGNTNVGNILNNNGNGNDTLNGSNVTINQVDLTITTPAIPINGGPVPLVNTVTGQISIPVGTPAGIYTIEYSICEKLNPTNCSSATITISVTAAVIDAVNDDYSANPIPSYQGGTTPSVIINDKWNGLQAVIGTNSGQVNLMPVSFPAGFTLNADGTINIVSNTAAGTYVLSYTICEVLNPSNCDTATATVFVAAQKPSIALVKTATAVDENGDGFATVGETIRYNFTVTNTGNVPLNNITISDLLPDLMLTGGPITLAAGQVDSSSFVGIYTITQADANIENVTNQATVSGTSPLGVIVKDLSDNFDNNSDGATVLSVKNCVLEVSNVLTPNGDGRNDYFHIEGLDCFSVSNVKIFNRWGVLVFETEKYNNTTNVFEGNSSGRTTISQSLGLPIGTYFYVIEYVDFSGNGVKKAGYLYLNR
jgi:gliding motility-associated-like protein